MILRPPPPATPEAIARIEEHYELKLPNSYRAFLELHDGYQWLASPGDMLRTADLVPGSPIYDEVIEWKKMSADYGSGEVLDGIAIANLGQPNDWAYLDPNRPTGPKEWTVVLHTPSYSIDYPDLFEFFESRIRYCLTEAPGEQESQADPNSD